MPPKKGNQASAHALRARAYYRNLPPAELRKAKFPDLEKDAGLNEPLLGCMQPEDAPPCDNYVPCAFLDMTGGNIESAADHGYAVTLGMKMPKAPSYRLPNGTFCDFETGRVWIAAGKQVQKELEEVPVLALRAEGGSVGTASSNSALGSAFQTKGILNDAEVALDAGAEVRPEDVAKKMLDDARNLRKPAEAKQHKREAFAPEKYTGKMPQPGQMLYLHSLSKRQDLNGMVATFSEFDKEKQRFVVKIEQAVEILRALPQNLGWVRPQTAVNHFTFEALKKQVPKAVDVTELLKEVCDTDTALKFVGHIAKLCDKDPEIVHFMERRGKTSKAFDAVANIDHEDCGRSFFRWQAFQGNDYVRGLSESLSQAVHRIKLMGEESLCAVCSEPFDFDGDDAGKVPGLLCGHRVHAGCGAAHMQEVGRGECPACFVVTPNIFAYDGHYRSPAFQEYGEVLCPIVAASSPLKTGKEEAQVSEKGSKSREGKTVHETPAYVGKAPAPKKTEAYLLAKEKQKEEEDQAAANAEASRLQKILDLARQRRERAEKQVKEMERLWEVSKTGVTKVRAQATGSGLPTRRRTKEEEAVHAEWVSDHAQAQRAEYGAAQQKLAHEKRLEAEAEAAKEKHDEKEKQRLSRIALKKQPQRQDFKVSDLVCKAPTARDLGKAVRWRDDELESVTSKATDDVSINVKPGGHIDGRMQERNLTKAEAQETKKYGNVRTSHQGRFKYELPGRKLILGSDEVEGVTFVDTTKPRK